MDTCAGACCSPSNVGSFQGDNSGCVLRTTRTGVGEACFTITLREDDSGCANTEGIFRLDLPTGVDYDLYVTVPDFADCFWLRESDNTFQPGCQGINSGTFDEVFVGAAEQCTFGSGDGVDQTMTVNVEVRWFGGSSCNNWTLQFSSGFDC
jgi:hypothetical protein